MFADGLVDEVRALLDHGLREGRTASRALGYAQVLAALDGATVTSAAAAADTVRATRRFVRRQRSWFRRDHRITWLDGGRRTCCGRAASYAWVHDRDPVRQGPRHGERLRRPARPRRHARPDRRPGRRAVRPPRGLGADGVLRVVRWAALKDDAVPRGARRRVVHGLPQRRRLVAEMCGNGVRVFAALARPRGLAARRRTAAARHPGRRPARCGSTGDGGVRRHGPGHASGRPSTAEVAAGRSRGRRSTSATRTSPASPTIALDALDLTRRARLRPRACSRTG